MDDHGASAGERRGAGLGEVQGGSGDEVLQWVQWHGSGCGAGGVDQRLPGCADPGWQVEVVPLLDESVSVDQFSDVVQCALGENDLGAALLE